jgi:hypothetical protein
MSVRTGAAIIATLKMFGVLMAVLELFTGPHFTTPSGSMSTFAQKHVDDDEIGYAKLPPSSTIETTRGDTFDTEITSFNDDESNPAGANSVVLADGQRVVITGPNQAGFGAVRFASTAIYLLVEAVAVSCLFYAFRSQRAKFVVPEMALIMICMSLELVVAILVIMGASFGSDSLVRMVVERLRASGTEVTSGDVDQIRRLIPFVLTAFAFLLLIGAAVEFWFFRTLKSYYVYLRDKATFRAMCDGTIQQQHRCYVNGYQPMMEEATNTTVIKDTPPAYHDVIKIEAQHAEPPSYVDSTQSAQAPVGQEQK